MNITARFRLVCWVLSLQFSFSSLSCSRERESPSNRAESIGVEQDLKRSHRDPLSSLAESGKSSGQPPETFRFFTRAMGTRFQITLVGYDEGVAQSVAQAGFNEVKRIERRVSSWIDSSEIGQLNARAGQQGRTPLSYETYWLLAEGKRISRNTRGAFDVTWAALKGLWDFKRKRIPTHQRIQDRLSAVGHELLSLSPSPSVDRALSSPVQPWHATRKDTPPESSLKREGRRQSDLYYAQLTHVGAKIDLGGIAKGYAIDSIATLLLRFGYRHFLIDGGGDLYAQGAQSSGAPWSVGIQHPRGRGLWATLSLPSGWSVVTSGDYERSFEVGGQRYHHIIDLRTGYPAQSSVAVTIFAQRALEADAWATGLFVLGPKEGLSLAQKTPHIEALFFDPNGVVHATQGVRQFTGPLPKRWRSVPSAPP